MMQKLRLLKLKGESGTVLVVVALLMLTLVGFIALAIDGGRIYLEKSRLQKALDSAVLAGAQELQLNDGGAKAKQVAEDISGKNNFPLDDKNLNPVVGDSITAGKGSPVPMTFAKVFGVPSITVHAEATAKILPLKKANGVVPIAVEKGLIPNESVPSGTIETQLNCGKNGKNHGNCGYIRLGDGSGASDLNKAIINGSTYEVGTTTAETEPGKMVGQVKDAITTLINNDSGKPQCQSALTADSTCSRVITIVVIDSWTGVNGSDQIKIVGLASYWLEPMNGNTIIGKFIKTVSQGEIGDGTSDVIGGYNLYGIKLSG
jgi:hypothetical protein